MAVDKSNYSTPPTSDAKKSRENIGTDVTDLDGVSEIGDGQFYSDEVNERKLRRRSRIWRLFTGVAGVVVGAVLGTVMQNYTNSDSSFRVLVLIAISVSIVLIVVIIGLSVFSRDAAQIERMLISSAARDRRDILDALRSLEAQVGVQVTCQSIFDLNRQVSLSEDKVIEAIREAKHTILVLDIAQASGRRPDQNLSRRVLREHFRVIAERAVVGVRYRRLSQVQDVMRGYRGVTDQEFLEHCKSICEKKEERQADATLKVTRMLYPYEFIIIDHRVIVVQLHQVHDLERTTWYEMIISDPSREIIDTFSQMWDDLYEGESTRTVGLSEVMESIRQARQ